MNTVHIGLGSNLGGREANCRAALVLLEERGARVLKVSSMHETEPWGVAGQPAFINAAAEVETPLEPEEFLMLINGIEKEMGRVKTVRWGPRVIDMDILLWGDLILEEPGLKVPHPGMHERSFVLGPLVEVAPGAVHPVLKKTVKELLDGLD